MDPSTRHVRVACPHNCYDTCSQIVTVVDGRAVQIDGDPNHPYTQGRLCTKGYAYLSRLYAPDRLRHPMLQQPRGSGQWRRITWEEALTRIAKALVALRDAHGSLLPVCLYQASGNLGLLHQAPAAFFGSMGPFTEAVNTLCWSAGYDAQTYDFGGVQSSDPRDMRNARTILLWGVNPAWTAPHQMRLIMQARDRGAQVITIDPLVTATASRSDLHVPIRPGTDAALALGMARHLLEIGALDEPFLDRYTHGWPAFRQYLREQVTLDWAGAETGLDPAVIRRLAERYGCAGPSVIWVGFGVQRYQNGGQTVRAIDALAALTGQIGLPGTGVQFGQTETPSLLGRMWSSLPWLRTAADQNRRVSMGDLSVRLPQLADPPVRALWVAGANPLSQGPDRSGLKEALRGLDLIVVVDQFLTQTTAEADIVLPTTTYLEQADLNASYWHHDIALNERAVSPLFEARSDLAIMQGLAAALNRLRPGFCPFPDAGSEEEWLTQLWGEEARRVARADCWEALRSGPHPAAIPPVAWQDRRFATPSGRFELWSDRAAARGLPPLPAYSPPAERPDQAFRLLTPHPAEGINSQLLDRAQAQDSAVLPCAEMHPDAAAARGLAEGAQARLVNERGTLPVSVQLTRTVPRDCVVVYSGTPVPAGLSVNALSGLSLTDMGALTAERGVAFAETFVRVEPLPGGGEAR